jgi:hypothetical protein
MKYLRLNLKKDVDKELFICLGVTSSELDQQLYAKYMGREFSSGETKKIRNRLYYWSHFELGLVHTSYGVFRKVDLKAAVQLAKQLGFKRVLCLSLGHLSTEGQGVDLVKEEISQAISQNSQYQLYMNLLDTAKSEKLHRPFVLNMENILGFDHQEDRFFTNLVDFYMFGDAEKLASFEEKVLQKENFLNIYYSVFDDFQGKCLLRELKIIPDVEDGEDARWKIRFSGKNDFVFYFHTEDIEFVYDGIKDYFEVHQKIKHVYLTASGFKALSLIQEQLLHEEAEIHWFDFSTAALSFYKTLLQNWDGVDYPKYIAEHYSLVGQTPSSEDKENWEKLWKKTLSVFLGPENFKLLWEKLKKMKHHFLNIDLIENPQKFVDFVADQKESVVFLSNIFDYQATIMKGSFSVFKSYIDLICLLKQKQNDIFVTGGNVYGTTTDFFVKELVDVAPGLDDSYL